MANIPPREQLRLVWGNETEVEPEPAQPPGPFVFVPPPITEHEGQPCVLDIDLGKALGYKDPVQIRQLIRRLMKRPSWGSCYHRNNMIRVGKGAHRFEEQYILTELQTVLVIMACGLPHADATVLLIANVFLAWWHGKSRPIDNDVRIELREPLDRVAAETPEILDLLAEQLPKMRYEITAFRDEVLRELRDIVHRKDAPGENVSLYVQAIIIFYQRKCPCCRKHIIIGDDNLPTALYVEEHWTEHPGKNALEQMWVTCVECNVNFRKYPGWRTTKLLCFQYFQMCVSEIIGRLDV